MNVPKLRFKEFNDEWQSINLANIFKYFNTNSLSREQLSESGILKNLHYGDIHKKYNSILNENDEITSYVKDINYVNKYELLKNNDLIFADASEDYEGIGKAVEVINVNNHTISGLHTILARDNLNVFAPMFKGYYFNSPIVHNQIRVLANGFKVYGISKDTINKLNIKIPSIQEQSKIANTLYLLDKKIELQSKKIEDLKLFKKGLIIHIRKNIEVEKIPLKNILTEQNHKTKKNNEYEILSSTSKGIYLQKDYFNKQAASDNNEGYKILKKNQLVLSPQNLWMGNININTEYNIGIVSPSYKIFNINNNINIDFFNYWIKSSKALYEYKVSSEQGASIVRRNLNVDLFYEIIVNVPKGELQNKLGNIIKLLNLNLQYNENLLQKIIKFKKGLMQSMFV
ncbi:restriction endonuclease subunit S [bacterium]|nr:restriction endonuclease subunit S [bacterium]